MTISMKDRRALTSRKRSGRTVKTPTDIDRHVGARIRQQRMLVGMSQETLAELIGITFQQVQKYEKGVNRIGAGRLLEISRALGVPIAALFDEQTSLEGETNEELLALQTLLSSREGIALARAFAKIRNAKLRQTFLAMAQAAAEQD